VIYTSHAFDIKDIDPDQKVRTDTILECLTDQCKDCSGSYINRLFGYKLICACKCHKSKKYGDCSVAETDLLSEPLQRKELETTLYNTSNETANQNQVECEKQG
jgi:hypothetical protein